MSFFQLYPGICFITDGNEGSHRSGQQDINPLNAESNLICHLLALLGGHRIFHVSGLRVKQQPLNRIGRLATSRFGWPGGLRSLAYC